jgi:protein TonB
MPFMKFLSLLLFALSLSVFAASDKGSVSVNGQSLEVEVERVYASALRRGIEGYVVVEFDVSPEGEVLDPYVVDTDRPGSFERASMRAVRRWAYEPYVLNGIAVRVEGVTARFTFQLAE